jgi:outer membrane protein
MFANTQTVRAYCYTLIRTSDKTHPDSMFRFYAILAFALLECVLLTWPFNATASPDVFNTEKFIAAEPYAGIRAICPQDLINKELGLMDVVELALCNNPQTRSSWAASRAQAAQLGASLATFFPTLSGPISVAHSRDTTGINSETRGANLTISYLLYDSGGRKASVESARQVLLATNATLDETLQTVYLNAVQAYYSLLAARASVQSSHAAEEAARKSLDAAQARYQFGTATPLDRLQAQTALSQAILNRISAEGSAAAAQGTLANIMGYAATKPFELAPVEDTGPDPVAENDIGKLIETAIQSRPDLLAAEAQIKAAEANVAVIRANGLPSISMNASIARYKTITDGLSDTHFSTGLGVSVNLPWFSGYRDTYNNRLAQAQLDNTKAQRDLVANQVALDVWKAYQTLLTNSQALQATDDLLRAAVESEKMASGRYKAGLGTILDVLTAQSTLASAQQQRVTAQYNFRASKFALAKAIGQLDLSKVGTKN